MISFCYAARAYPRGDYNLDGDVDFSDYAFAVSNYSHSEAVEVVAKHWLGGE